MSKIGLRQQQFCAIIFDDQTGFITDRKMNSWKRLLFYIVLNIFVSACTVLVVLFTWDQFSGPVPRGLLPTALSNLAVESTPTRSLTKSTTPVPQVTPTQSFEIYQVQSGDTFESLAEQFGCTVEELLAANGFKSSQPIGENEMLRIPSCSGGGVKIDGVIGAGDLDTEYIRLKHAGKGQLSLVGWRVEDGEGNILIFPQFPELTLYENGVVNIYTKAGSNSVIELFWGLDHPVWKSGKTVTLKDPQGTVRATYLVP